MSKDKIADYDGTTAGNNTDIGGISIAEGMLPSAVNNSMRELTKQLGAFANGTDAIDALTSDGNILVGTTDTVPSNNGAGGDAGVAISPDGVFRAARSGNVSIDINRMDSDGEIAAFRKDGTTVGLIGSKVGDLTIGTDDTGLRFYDAGNALLPYNTSTQASPANTLDLGDSGSSFKDLYLGGNLYIGGTGSANGLSDYEEGTFTPSFTGGITGSSYEDQNGTYVKIGQLVFFALELDITNGAASANGNQIKIDNIPFVSAAASPMVYGQGGAWVTFNNNFYNVDTGIYLEIPTNTNQIRLYRGSGNNLAGNDTGVNAQNNLHIAGCYRTA